MTIHPKDHQTHHIQAPSEHLKGIPVIPIVDLLTMKLMAVTMMVTTQTQGQFTHQYPNQNLNPNLRTLAKYSQRPSPDSWNL